MKRRLTLLPTRMEAALLLLFAALCSIQLFIPPFIGLANNGDFAKVHGRFALGQKDLGDYNFKYFVDQYEFGPRYYWKSNIFSAENVLAAGPVLLARAAGARTFDIRWLGALHAAFYVAALYALLLYLRRFGVLRQFAVAAVALILFTDVAYVSYMNSFYSDASALLGAVLMMAAAAHLASKDGRQQAALLAFVAGAALYIGSKTQHALWGFIPAFFVVWATWRRPARAAGIAAGVALLAAEAGMFAASPKDYKLYPLFNLVFFKLAPLSPEPLKTLEELGLGPQDARLVGMNAYSQGSPMGDKNGREDFARRTSYLRVVKYYLRHPDRTAQVLFFDLRGPAYHLRQLNMSNFRKVDGHPPYAMTERFALWSGLQGRAGAIGPWFYPAWYVLAVGGCVWLAIRRRALTGQSILFLGIAAMGLLEFLFASLADACETDRHMLLFHIFTDATLVGAALALATRITARKRRLAGC